MVLSDKFALQRQRAVTRQKTSACKGGDEGVEGGVQSSLIEWRLASNSESLHVCYNTPL